MDKLNRPPIIEAVVDIDCDLSPGLGLLGLEGEAAKVFADSYPISQKRFMQQHTLPLQPSEAGAVSNSPILHALQYISPDRAQLVQVRDQGYSFNRLAPYTSFDDYLPEIERTWALYAAVVKPLHVRAVGLRFINRISIPLIGGTVELEQYFELGPKIPANDLFTIVGFLNQYTAVEKASGHQVNSVLTAQDPEDSMLPIVFDITVAAQHTGDPADWPAIAARIGKLRALKNDVFRKTLREECLNLFK